MTQVVQERPRAKSLAKAPRVKPNGLPKPVLGLIGVFVFLGLWELMPVMGVVKAKYLPPTSEVLAALAADLGMTAFWVSVGDTMLAWFLGLAIAVVLALVLGLVIGMSRSCAAPPTPPSSSCGPIPSVALIPLAVLMFGIRSSRRC